MENVIQFADYEVLQDRREIRRAGALIELGSRAYDMLMVFLHHHGDTLTKSELLELVWPESVVEDSNVYTQISALRAALDPNILATVPGRGYRLLAPVEGLPARAKAEERGNGTVRLFGRARQTAALRRMLAQHRLITITGAGGVGKTALARAHVESLGARRHCAWTDLSLASHAQCIAPLIAQSLQIAAPGDAITSAGLLSALHEMRALLVLDGAEHVMAGVAALVRQILEVAPHITLCVTSQVPLKLDAERLIRLEGLLAPAPGSSMDTLLSCGSVQLFSDQAQSVLPSFKLDASNIQPIGQICRQLEGLPLSIKLAADRLPVFGVSGVLSRMDELLRLLVSHRPYGAARHQSMRATLEWSDALLFPSHRAILSRLAVFPGQFTPLQAMAVVADLVANDWELMDAISVLLDRSLLMTDQREPPRYRLPATSRPYWLEKRGPPEVPGLATQLLVSATV